ncbi:MAG TPA: poly-gamma-glutamate system protein [Bacteroidetes bacterium]|nr:poly-gamma-glutamate system protein [Bacteroidota bacterium]
MINRLAILLLTVTVYVFVPQKVEADEWDSTAVAAMARRAEETVRRAYGVLWDFKLQFDLADTVRDPGHTGVMGEEYSPVTTTIGYEYAKELSTKPGWAGWLVRELAEHGIWKGADVAVSMSGSFPALNIAVLAALQELGADVNCISSVGASSYGANEPGLSWPEMERLLREEHVLKIGSSAVTLGGTGDRGLEWNDYGMDMAMRSVKRSLLPLIKPTSLRDAIRKRIRFYGNPRDYFCYINVGGSQASLGGGARMRFDRGGWYYEPLPRKGDPSGVMDRFLADDVPCLNLLFLERLDKREGITSR